MNILAVDCCLKLTGAAIMSDGVILGHEQGDGILFWTGAEARQGIAGRQRANPPEVGPGILRHFRIHDAQGLDQRHTAALPDGGDETAPPPLVTERVQDQGSLPDLGGIQDDELGAVDHQYCWIRSLESAWRSVSS